MLAPNSLLQHGRYRIVRRIGQGGMGAVYEARDERLNVKVALKESLVSDQALRDAFEQEAQRLARLRHSALPNVMDHFVEGNGQYLVMEYIEGADLAEQLKAQTKQQVNTRSTSIKQRAVKGRVKYAIKLQVGAQFAVQEVLGWAERLLDGLAYLHGQQPPVIHRDTHLSRMAS